MQYVVLLCFVQANVGRYVALSSVSTLELGSKTAVLRVVALCTAGPLADLSELSSVRIPLCVELYEHA